MSSASIVDYLTEKLYSYTSKMKADPHQQASFLMSGNTSHQYDLLKVLNEFKESTILPVDISDSHHPSMPLLRPFGMLSGLMNINGINRSNSPFNYHSENGRFSPHLFNLALNSYRYKHSLFDSSLMPLASMFFGHVKENLFESPTMSQHSKTDNSMKKTCEPPIFEAKMLVKVSQSPTTNKVEVADEKFKSHSLRLNLELANRKTKEMNKRSKKRRRRQKKIEHLNASNSASASDDDDVNGSPPPVTSRVCFLSESPDFKCTVSVKHTQQMPPQKSSFIIPVQSDSDDDSDWETVDKIELCDTSNSTLGSEVDWNIVSSTDSSPVKSDCSDYRYSTPTKCAVQVTSSIVSFIVPEGDSSDDDSEWDTCEANSYSENTDFEFTGLFLSNLCTPQTISSKTNCNSSATAEEECDEVLQLTTELLEANKKWNEQTKDDDEKPKSASKVTFAPDEDLVEICPVEICERKGEWEIYATERLRFKRKIDELEKILSPCLNPEHRSKVFKKFIEPEL